MRSRVYVRRAGYTLSFAPLSSDYYYYYLFVIYYPRDALPAMHMLWPGDRPFVRPSVCLSSTTLVVVEVC